MKSRVQLPQISLFPEPAAPPALRQEAIRQWKQGGSLPDITRNKHGGHPNSEAANAGLQQYKASMRRRIRVYVATCGFRGATVHEIASALKDDYGQSKQPHEVSGRLTELKADGLLFASRRQRGGAEVLVARREHISPPQEKTP